jgi:hypothetical protein
MHVKKTKTAFPKWLLAMAVAVIGLVALVGWKLYERRYPSWDEEVRLSDGRVITIHQKREVYDNYGTNQSWVTIDLPELGGKQVWHSYLMPQRVDVIKGKVYAFGAPRGIRQYQHYLDPKNYLVAFEWSGVDFIRIPFLKIPEAIRQEENIYPCVPIPKSSRITLQTKDQSWCPARGDKWKFGKSIVLSDYQNLALFYAELGGTKPVSD